MMKLINIESFLALLAALLIMPFGFASASQQRETSVAGFIPLEGCGREVMNFNQGWRYHKGDVADAYRQDFDDSGWDVVALPHSVELMPAEASGCRNYQGIVWYRKSFVLPTTARGRNALLHFEAVMGRQKIFVNGAQLTEHAGGYLPFEVDLTAAGVKGGDSCVIAVIADNSNDKNYPPGKTQYTLDFAYHGGIYRDVWLIIKDKVAITDAITAAKPASGGVFVHYSHISHKSATVHIDVDVLNSSNKSCTIKVENELCDSQGTVITRVSSSVNIKAQESRVVREEIVVAKPILWSMESPYLYRINTRIKENGRTIDGGTTRAGIRLAEFRGKDGFFLNGKPLGKLIGANRHQDFAYVGNALPKSGQWRDAELLHQSGCRIVRSAHYPQDPAFMDACDQLGIFVIVATPGWQYWNNELSFGELVHKNTREMIRRDRNHPSVLMWEPILNETRFPLDFSLKALDICRNEYPYPGAPCVAADMLSEGVAENYDVVYGWPQDEGKGNKPIFTREFGENVDDWYSHNNNNRASRSWGEGPQLVQALSLARSYGAMFSAESQFVGGALWHPFDHQRGYHPDPYWGGIFDAFRQPKYAYYLFRSQVLSDGYMAFMANEMTPFSPSDITVMSNCDSVRLTTYGQYSTTLPVVKQSRGIPCAPVVFKGKFDFWQARKYSYIDKNWQQVTFLVEGIVDGKVVCSQTRMPSRRSTKLRLALSQGQGPLEADGSDFVVAVAEVTDDNGNVRRLAKENVLFTIQGEGEIIGDASIGANPRAVEFGSAPVLVRSSSRAGKITLIARVLFEGTHAPTADTLTFYSVPSPFAHCFVKQSKTTMPVHRAEKTTRVEMLNDNQKQQLLEEVERQQTEFGEKKGVIRQK